MTYKYGEFSDNQIEDAKKFMQKKIFYLLICVDPKSSDEHKNTDVYKVFDDMLLEFGGLNSLLFCPPTLIRVMSLLEAALIEYSDNEYDEESFKTSKLRKLILDAGSEVMKIKEV